MPNKIIPVKKRYYVVSMGSEYGNREMFHFQNLENALEMFKFLQKREAITIENNSIKTFSDKEDDGDNYSYEYYNSEDESSSTFHLESKVVDIYTKEQIKQIEEIENEKIKGAKKSKKKKGKK